MRHGEQLGHPDMGLADKILAAARKNIRERRFVDEHNIYQAVDEIGGFKNAKDERSRAQRDRLIAIVRKELRREEHARLMRDAAAHERELTAHMTPDDLGLEEVA